MAETSGRGREATRLPGIARYRVEVAPLGGAGSLNGSSEWLRKLCTRSSEEVLCSGMN